ncbi:MAG: extracellular solute-binding protein [Anaerocolumna sp.]
MKKRCKKIISISLVLLMALIGAIGCSKDTPTDSSGTKEDLGQSTTDMAGEQSQSEDKIKLTFWYTYGDSEEAQLKDVVIPKWNALHPDIEIEPVRQDSSQYNQMIVTAFGTGQTPDVARVDIINTASYANQHGIIALSDRDGFEELKSTFLNAPMSTNYYQGKYYGLPLDTNCKAAVINENVMKALGIDGVPATMEEFISAAKEKGNGGYLLNVSGVGDWDLLPYFWLFGGSLTDDTFTTASGYLDSDASVQAINTMLELNEEKIFTIRDIDGSVDAWDGIITGEYAMFFEGPWYFGSYEDSEEQGIIPALIPTYHGESASVVGGENIVVFEASKNQDAAYEFAQFMDSEEIQLDMLKTGQLPVLKSLVENEAVTSEPVWSIYMKQMESAKARIPSPNQTIISEIWSDTMTDIFANKADVKTELSNTAKLIDEQLAEDKQ